MSIHKAQLAGKISVGCPSGTVVLLLHRTESGGEFSRNPGRRGQQWDGGDDHLQLSCFAKQRPLRVCGDVASVCSGQRLVPAVAIESDFTYGYRRQVDLPGAEAGGVEVTENWLTVRAA